MPENLKPQINLIEINIRPISNGFVGNVDVRHGGYACSETPDTFYATLAAAIADLSAKAGDPEKIVADCPPVPEADF